MFLDGRMNSSKYQQMLTKYFLTFAVRISGKEWTLQQDNCSSHVSKDSRKWFNDHNIPVLDWPSLSPDLNIIENMWGLLVKRVYGGGRQFASVDQLKQVLIQEWEEIDQKVIQNLFNSMDNRLFEVILKNGNKTHY